LVLKVGYMKFFVTRAEAGSAERAFVVGSKRRGLLSYVSGRRLSYVKVLRTKAGTREVPEEVSAGPRLKQTRTKVVLSESLECVKTRKASRPFGNETPDRFFFYC
jgi:hypothetical protein